MKALDIIRKYGDCKHGDSAKAIKKACGFYGLAIANQHAEIPELYVPYVSEMYQKLIPRAFSKWKDVLTVENTPYPCVQRGYSLQGNTDAILLEFRDYIQDRRVVEIDATNSIFGDWASGVAYDFEASTEHPILLSKPVYKPKVSDTDNAVVLRQIPFYREVEKYEPVINEVLDTSEGILVCPIGFFLDTEFDVLRNIFFAKFEIDFMKYCDFQIVNSPVLCPVIFHYFTKPRMSRKNHMDILYVNYYKEPHTNSVVLEQKYNWRFGAHIVDKFKKPGNPYGLRVLREDEVHDGWHDSYMMLSAFKSRTDVMVDTETKHLFERAMFGVKLQDTRNDKHGKLFSLHAFCRHSAPMTCEGGASIVFPGYVPDNDVKNLAYATNVALMHLRGSFDGMLMLRSFGGNCRRIDLDVLFGIMTYYMQKNKWRFVEIPE